MQESEQPEQINDKEMQVHSQDEPSPPRSTSHVTLTIATIALLLSMASLGVQFWVWQNYKKTEAKLLDHSQQLENRLQPAFRNILEQQNIQQKELTSLLAQNGQEARKKFLFAAEEAKHLIILGQYNLEFDHNTELAVFLLSEADRKLQDLNDPATSAIRKELNNALVALNTTPKLDITGLIARLGAISNQASNLMVLPVINPQKNSSTSAHPLTWKEKFLATLQHLKGIISIRRLQEPVQPLPSPENQAFILEEIRLQLAQAQWAVLHLNPALYQMSLQNAKTQLQKYFGRTIQGASLIQMIVSLQQVNLKPSHPDLTNIINLLQNYLTSAQQSLATSSNIPNNQNNSNESIAPSMAPNLAPAPAVPVPRNQPTAPPTLSTSTPMPKALPS